MESISRISSLLETARDLTLEAARDAGSARRATAARAMPSAQVQKLLQSRNEREVLEGMRRVLASQYAGQPTTQHLTSAINALAFGNPTLKRLVSIHLLAHAETAPDTALLSINTLQKSLSDASPATRALALRTMSAVRVPAVSAIVALAVKRGAADLHATVRRAAAFATVKCVRLDPGMRLQMEEVLETLLGDREYYVTGAAIAAWRELVGMRRWEVLHKHYRSLVRKLLDMDEWGQVATLECLVVYARHCFPRRSRRVKKKVERNTASRSEGSKRDALEGFYDDVGDSPTQAPQSNEQHADDDETEEVPVVDPDLDLLLQSASPLLYSRNSAVVVTVVKTYLYLAPSGSSYLENAIGPLIALLRSPKDIQQLALRNIEHLCLTHAPLFTPFTSHFLVRATDDQLHIAPLKLSILASLFPHASSRTRALILTDLSHLARSTATSDEADAPSTLARAAIRAISRCAYTAAQSGDTGTSTQCLSLLHSHLSSPSTALVSEALDGLRGLIALDPEAHAQTTVVRLAASLDAAKGARARASIIWLVGEFAGVVPEENIAADVLRLLLKGFADEEVEVRSQIILLAAKVYCQHLNVEHQRNPQPLPKPEGVKGEGPWADNESPSVQEEDEGNRDRNEKEEKHSIEKLWSHALLLARYDTSYDLRDRSRVYRALLSVSSSTELASLLLLAPKPAPSPISSAERRHHCIFGGIGLIIGDEGARTIGEGGALGVSGEDALPDWVRDGLEPAARLRDAADEKKDYVAKSFGVVSAAADRLDEAAGKSADEVMTPKRNGLKEKTLDDWLAEDDEEVREGEASEDESEEDTSSGEYEIESEDAETESEDETEDEAEQLVK